MEDSNESLVLERFRQGDHQAVGPLLEKLRPYIRVIVRTALVDRPPAGIAESDLIQNVLLQAVRANATFHGNCFGEFARWLRTIAVRTSRESLQRAAGRESPRAGSESALAVAVDERPGPQASLLEQENAAHMAAALQRLPGEMRRVLLLRLVDGLSHAQIAEQVDRSPGAVRMLFLRAVERLREECGTQEQWF